MYTLIVEAISSIFGSIGSMIEFMSKKNTENIIRKSYEEEKKADNLEEDKIGKAKADKANSQVSKTEKDVKAVRDADIKDAELSDVEIQAELSEIEDNEDKHKRLMEINAAIELKKRKSSAVKKIKDDKSFDAGEEITFGG